MQRYNKAILASFALAALVGATTIQAADIGEIAGVQANTANGEKIFKEGKGSVPACSSCHGPEGMGNDSMGTPRLAGQIMPFVLKQLEDFAADKRMDTTMFVMNANAKGLSPQDRKDVAAYVSTKLTVNADLSNLKDLGAAGTVVGSPHLGKALVLYGRLPKEGVPEAGVPACQSCHGYNGRGVEPIYPQIGRQKYNYLVNQLKKWRDGSRANDPMAQMQKVAHGMSDEDIANVAAYLSGAAPTTLGNSRTPEQHLPLGYDIR